MITLHGLIEQAKVQVYFRKYLRVLLWTLERWQKPTAQLQLRALVEVVCHDQITRLRLFHRKMLQSPIKNMNSEHLTQNYKWLYLWFLPKQPQLVLGSAHMFWVRSWPRGPFSLSFSFRCAADGPVWTRSAQILTKVLEGEVAWRIKTGLKRLHDDGCILGWRDDKNRRIEREGIPSSWK